MKMNVGDGGDGAMGSLVELLFWIFGVGEGEGGGYVGWRIRGRINVGGFNQLCRRWRVRGSA